MLTDPWELRAAPPGLPPADIAPPVVAESGDPFTNLRVVHLVARIPRGRRVEVRSIVARLNAEHVDWLFDERVVADALLQLQANWMVDYRNASGIVLEDVPGRGSAVTLEDSSRVDPWIVQQAERARAACRQALLEFSRRDRPTGE